MLRLFLLYTLACFWILAAGLAGRATQEAGFGLDRVLPRMDAPGASPPFAGVTVQLAGRSPANIEARLTALRQAGFGWARQTFDWRKLEPARGQFDWTEADALVDAITNAGLTPVAVLNSAPDWALAPADVAADNGLAPPARFADFAHFVDAFTRRYGDRIRYYQIWDEPNIAPHWGARHINPVAYAQMLRAVTPVIRNADNDAVVLAAALAPTVDRGHLAMDEVYFLQRMIAAGATPFFDAVAVQPFGFGYSPAHPRQNLDTLNFARVAWIRRALVEAGMGEKPIWAVRYGWNRTLNSPWGAVTPVAQATYAGDALARAWHDWPWLAAMGWVIDQPAEPPRMPAWGFALTNAAGTPAPVFAAVAAWQTTPRTRGAASTFPVPLVEWLLLLLAGFLIGWRALAAGRLVNWRSGLARYRQAPGWLHTGVWIGLAVVYYLATFPPLIGLCWLAAMLLCLAQPRVGLWVAVALIPFYYQHKEVQLVDVMLAAPPTHMLLFALLPALWRSPPAPRASPPLIWWELAPLLLLPMTLAAALNVWYWPAFMRGALDLVLAPLLLWWAVRVLATTDAERARVLAALFAGGVLAALIGLAGWLHNGGVEVDGIRRLVGPHFSSNHTALYLERSLFLGLALLLMTARRWREITLTTVLLIMAVVVVVTALGLTGSRGALLFGLPAGLVVMAGFAGRRRPGMRRSLLYLAAMGGGALILALLVWQRERLSNLETVVLRLEVWRAALALWRDHFWAGVGPSGFFWSYPAYLRVGAVEVDQLHPHSLWLELVTTWGVLGLAWFVLSVAALVRAMQQHSRSNRAACWVAMGACAGLAAALAHAQTDTFLSLADLAAWNAVAWALATAPTVPIQCHAGSATPAVEGDAPVDAIQRANRPTYGLLRVVAGESFIHRAVDPLCRQEKHRPE